MDEILNNNNHCHGSDNINNNDEQGAHSSPSPSRSLIITATPQQPLAELICQSLVVGKYVAFAAIILAVCNHSHREISIHKESHQENANVDDNQYQQ